MLNYVPSCVSCRLIGTMSYKNCNCLVVETLKPKVSIFWCYSFFYFVKCSQGAPNQIYIGSYQYCEVSEYDSIKYGVLARKVFKKRSSTENCRTWRVISCNSFILKIHICWDSFLSLQWRNSTPSKQVNSHQTHSNFSSTYYHRICFLHTILHHEIQEYASFLLVSWS